MYQCSEPGCASSTESHYCVDHCAADDQRVTCMFCRREFDELPFYGCCSSCYQRSATVRLLVDAATPQTIREEVL